MTVAGPKIVIAGRDNPVLGDYVAHLRRTGPSPLAVASTPDDCRTVVGAGHAVVLFLSRHPDWDYPLIDAVARLAADARAARVCVISSFLVHFGDHRACAVEAYARERLSGVGAAPVVIRLSLVASPHSARPSPSADWPDGFRSYRARLTGCCLDVGEELFTVIDDVLNPLGRPAGPRVHAARPKPVMAGPAARTAGCRRGAAGRVCDRDRPQLAASRPTGRAWPSPSWVGSRAGSDPGTSTHCSRPRRPSCSRCTTRTITATSRSSVITTVSSTSARGTRVRRLSPPSAAIASRG